MLLLAFASAERAGLAALPANSRAALFSHLTVNNLAELERCIGGGEERAHGRADKVDRLARDRARHELLRGEALHAEEGGELVEGESVLRAAGIERVLQVRDSKLKVLNAAEAPSLRAGGGGPPGAASVPVGEGHG